MKHYTLPTERAVSPLTLWRCYGVTITLVALLLLLTLVARCETLTEARVARIADAIYLAEGGAKAKVPYGILSVKVKDEADARRVCMNTIRNNWRRWQDAGSKGDYLEFLADKYCPPSVDPVGNRNWKRNVRKLMEK